MASNDIVCNNLKGGRPVYLKYNFEDIFTRFIN